MGVCFCKKVDLSPTQGALCTVSVFFIAHFTYFGGFVSTQRTPCLPACSVATYARYVGIFNNLYTVNLLENQPVATERISKVG